MQAVGRLRDNEIWPHQLGASGCFRLNARSVLWAADETAAVGQEQWPPLLTPNGYFFDKQTFADVPIDYRAAPTANRAEVGLATILLRS